MICSGVSYNERVTALHLLICIHESTASPRPGPALPPPPSFSFVFPSVAVVAVVKREGNNVVRGCDANFFRYLRFFYLYIFGRLFFSVTQEST